MFLKRLYYHSRLLFFVFILFVSAFLVLNYKWGAVATPIYQYGMFSGVMKKKNNIAVYSFYSNDTLLNLTDISFPQRDKIMVGIHRYITNKVDNAAFYQVMRNFLSKAGLGSSMDEKIYTINVNDLDFSKWLQNNIENVVGTKVNDLAGYITLYNWHGNKLVQQGEPIKLRFIGAEQ